MAGPLSRSIISLASSTRDFQRRTVEQQGGLLDGKDPTKFSEKDPIRLWIIQVGIIVMVAQLLAIPLKRIREPKVIAEVLGGILLGPTALGRIPGFTQHIFPSESLPYLSLTANIGLVLFLFLVGLEIETNVIKRNARFSIPIALGGMTVPFGLGAALALPIYKHYIDENQTSYPHFMLFTGVAFSITAFPVLCRILTELKLVDTTVGIVVLSAGVGNDIVGWTLLALAVALLNASTGLSAVWILLTAVAWTLFLLIPVKRAFKWLARRTESIENGPTMTFMTATILMTFTSAFFTDSIGVHAIFGGFLAGLVVPREGGLAIALTEKLEDMVSIIFLPLYFTLSGLQTNLGLLDNGTTWGFTIAICCLAFFGKFGGCSVAARLCGFGWREASTIGSLMSCKGLVELIVLNVGLDAGILTQRVFSMFVFEALLLTCLTTPTVLALYPPSKRARAVEIGPNYRTATEEEGKPDFKRKMSRAKDEWEDAVGEWKTRFTVVLDKIEHLPGMMALTQLVCPPCSYTKLKELSEKEMDIKKKAQEVVKREEGPHARPSGKESSNLDSLSESLRSISVDAMRLIELSDRTSAVMKSTLTAAGSESHLLLTDPLLNVFRTFSELNGLEVSSSLSVVTFSDLAHRVADRTRDTGSDLVLVPWLPPSQSSSVQSGQAAGTGAGAAPPVLPTPNVTTPLLNPFDMLFRTQSYSADKFDAHGPKAASVVHSQFVRSVFAQCKMDVALYVDRTTGSGIDGVQSQERRHGRSGVGQHIFLPFFGGPDDRLALEFVVQLCANPRNSATVIRITKTDAKSESESVSVSESDEAPSETNGEKGTKEMTRPEKAHTKGKDEREAEAEAEASAAASIRANGISIHSTYDMPDTVYGAFTTQTRLQSETADNITWERYASPSGNPPPPPAVAEALSRITFRTRATPRPLHFVIEKIFSLSQPQTRPRPSCSSQLPRVSRKITVILGRSRRLAVEDHSLELKELLEQYHGSGSVGGEVRKTVGDVASAIIGYSSSSSSKRCDVGIVVMQATRRGVDDGS
ncbi:KHA1_2 [Sanghuangporus vaninii]